MTVESEFGPTEQSKGNKYVYLDKATNIIAKAIGLDMSEKHVEKISKVVGLKTFKIGSRKAFERATFEDKFEDFVGHSSRELGDQTKRRVKGATFFNEKIDAVFAYLDLSNKQGIPFTYAGCLEFLKAYDEEQYGTWDEFVLQTFVRSRGARKGGSSQRKAEIAARSLSFPAISEHNNEKEHES